MRFDFNASLVVVQNPKPADDNDVAGDDEDDEPRRELPAVGPPREDGESGEGEEEEAFVGEGIEEGAELGELIKLASEVSIEGVGEGGDNEDADGSPTESFVGIAAFDPKAVVDSYCYEDGDQKKPEDGDVGGESQVVGRVGA